MGMDDVGQARHPREVIAERRHEAGHLRGQCLLLQIGGVGGREALNFDLRRHELARLAVRPAQPGFVERAGDDDDLFDIGKFALMHRGLENISDVARVGGDAERDGRRLQAAAQGQMQDDQLFLCCKGKTWSRLECSRDQPARGKWILRYLNEIG
ncbi:hypothetical protein AB5I41_07135 [Sphingomonas sp. MMS24-JH45]